jgi:cellulose synthase/poly-beta-1,6-N-acetylglucosamine synthase-like glycosyltransferase
VYFANRSKIFKNPGLRRFPSITFLVPAYNEEKNIRKCLDSLASLNYPKEKLKIIVIDDGSTDNTGKIVKEYKDVKLITQKNSGKATALNHGLKYVDTELVATMDADSCPDRNYLLNLVGYLEKKDVAAATPAIKVSKVSSWLTKIQWVEYLYQVFLRKVFSIFGCEYVVPGPGGVYKTSIVKEIGGWDEKSITEDMEITFRLRKKGYRILNSINAFTYTNVPNKFSGLWNQRIRWFRGYLQNVKKHSYMILNPKYGNFGIFFLPINFVWIFVLAFLLFSFIWSWGNTLISSLINWSFIGYVIPPIEIEIGLFNMNFYSFFQAVFLPLGLLSIWLSITSSKEKIKIKKSVDRFFLFIFVYPFLISLWWVVATLLELLRFRRKW